MPRGDRTGPEGKGSQTGRGMGFCTGHNNPGYMNIGFGGGRGFGRGLGRGFRSGYLNTETQTKEEQKTALETELKNIEAEKQELKRRLEELK